MTCRFLHGWGGAFTKIGSLGGGRLFWGLVVVLAQGMVLSSAYSWKGVSEGTGAEVPCRRAL